jgi:hypothetical protein
MSKHDILVGMKKACDEDVAIDGCVSISRIAEFYVIVKDHVKGKLNGRRKKRRNTDR